MTDDALARFLPAIRRLDVRPTPVAAIVSALLPLLGVLAFDWPVASMLGFYWAENVLLGVFHLFKILAARGLAIDPSLERAIGYNPNVTPEQAQQQLLAAQRFQHFVMPGVFVLHYGLFCAAHAGAIALLFDGAFADFATGLGFATLAASAVQHALDTRRFVGDDELRALPRGLLMFQPYSRIVVMQLALLLGAITALAGYELISALLLATIRVLAEISGVFSLRAMFERRGGENADRV